LAFNLLLKRPPGAAVALAVEPRDTAQTYFLLPWRGLVMAGTSYAPLAEGHLDARPSAQQIEAFLADLNRAIPGLNVNLGDVLRVYAGLLPANTSGTVDLASRETIHDHGAGRGPQGLFSVRGVKYTTARLVAQKALIKALGKALPPVRADAVRPPPALIGQGVLNEASPLDGPADRLAAVLRELAAQEAVMCLDDLLMRRIDSTLTAQDPDAAARARGLLGPDLPDVVG
jgi:glycerol-3-phosphate dehydrogenase